MKIYKIRRALIYLYIISFSVCIANAFDDKSRNMLLVYVMAISPLIIMFHTKLYSSDVPLFLFMAALIIFPQIMNPYSMRWSTVLYSCLFCLSFLAFKRMILHGYFSSLDYERLIRMLIYCYVLTLLLQQFCVLVSLPVPNLRFYDQAEPWKLNSLGAEPSWAGRILGLLMYTYIFIKEINLRCSYSFLWHLKGKDKWLWYGFFWAMLSMGSATAIVFLGLVLIKLIRFRNLLPLIIACFVLLYVAENNDLTSFNRTKNIIFATVTLNEEAIVEADHSASFRIVPIIALAKMINFTTFEDWFGHGVDYVKNYIDLNVPGSKGKAGGGFFSVMIEYGLISFALLIYISIKSTIIVKNFSTYVFWFMLIFIYGLNVQIPWLAMMLLYSNKNFHDINGMTHNRLNSSLLS